jgi:chorismate synthase
LSNSFGKIFKVTTFGESHGSAIGGIIDGCPAGLELDMDAIQHELDRRKPGQSNISTPRTEEDKVEFLSGIFEGKTTGTPIGFLINNKDQRSKDYSELKDVYRPSHADFTYDAKYGFRDYRGGGRSSARETATRVVAGAIAKQILAIKGISIAAYVKSVGKISIQDDVDFEQIPNAENSIVRCPVPNVSTIMETAINEARESGDSLGGVIHSVIRGVNPGLGEPVFDKFNAVLAHAMMSINAVKGFEIGSGFSGSQMRGSEHNDAFVLDGKKISTQTNYSGGVQGGLTNGQDVTFNVAFKPVATISKEQDTVTTQLESTKLSAKGRHDPCVVPRAVPIVEAMAALVTLDFLLRSKTNRIDQF